MNNLYHLSLEKEIVLEMDPFGTSLDVGQPPAMRRETVLAVLSRSAQLALPFHELLKEAGLLAASALDMEYFGYAEVGAPSSFSVGWGSVADCTRNVDPVPAETARDAATSGFAFAAASAHPIVVADAAGEERFRDAQLIGHGVRSGIFCPVRYREQQYGAVGTFSTRQRTLTKSDVMFVQSIALLLGPTRAHQNAERTLAEHSRFLSATIDSLDAMVIMLREDGAVTQINRTCLTLSGFTANELRGRKIWSAFFVPAEADGVQMTLNELRCGSSQRRFDASFLTKSGTEKRISWTIARLPVATGDAALMATGIDITDQHRALSKLNSPETSLSATPTAKNEETLVTATPNSETSGRERRTHDRRPYSCVQSVAPCIHGKLPERTQFRPVRCHDISPRGFSFLLAAPPDFEELVAAFGSAQSRLYLRGRVVHSTPFRQGGRNVVLVGCEYSGRVRLPWIGTAVAEEPFPMPGS
jgi:PAS domain S-box-containing protein